MNQSVKSVGPRLQRKRLVAGLSIVLFAGLIGALPGGAQAPSTDIALLSVHHIGDEPAVGGFQRVTDRERYDNQPAFLDEVSLAYTAMDEERDSTDIWLYDLETKSARPLVTTPESEYSATLMPIGVDGVTGPAISVVRDYGNLRQELWAYELDDGPARPIRSLLPGINPIGYHAWLDSRRLLLFVLGEPATLQRAEIGPLPGLVLADEPGRALVRTASDRGSFVHKVDDGEWWLTEVDVVARSAEGARGDGSTSGPTMRRLIRMPAGSEDYAWAPDGTVWTSRGSRLLVAGPFGTGDASRPEVGQPRWRPVGDVTSVGLRDLGVGTISRLAFSPAGDRLAIVFERR